MRQLLIIFVFALFMPLAMDAQEGCEIIPVDWKEVEKVAQNAPQRIKDLVARMAASEIDRTMTWNERILAYYGQSYLTPNTELSEGLDLDKLMKEGNYVKCLADAKELLKKNPVSLKALSSAAFAISRMARDTINHYDVSIDDAKVYFNRMGRILNTIAITGDGTEEKPFYVTAVSDEYLFMRYYLDIWEINNQSYTGKCDILELKKTSKYYSREKICFETTRVTEIEMDLFK